MLEELRREQAKIPNVGGHVFTRRNGRVIKNVREAWLKAVATGVRKKQLPDDDFRPHDLRRSAITFGVPRDSVMAAGAPQAQRRA